MNVFVWFRTGFPLVVAVVVLAGCWAAEPGPATLYSQRSHVTYRIQGGPVAALPQNGSRSLGVSDDFATDGSGQARLVFADQLAINAYHDTQLDYDVTTTQGQPSAYTARIARGAAEVAKRIGTKFEIATKWANIIALGTEFFIHYDPDREMTWVIDKHGQVAVTAAGETVTLQANEQTWVEPGKAPVKPLPACRDLVGTGGGLFPTVEQLTNDAISDLQLLCPRSATPTPTPTQMRAPTITPMPTQMRALTIIPTERPTIIPSPTVLPKKPDLVLANYFGWYDLKTWDTCQVSDADKPLQPYSSDESSTIARHIAMAQQIGIDGFTLQWVGPGNRTDSNFATLLSQASGTSFRSTVVFLYHYFERVPSQAEVISALRYLIKQYSDHPNFLKINGRPVIFFTDMGRVAREGNQDFIAAWRAIRDQVDSNRRLLWVAEGLEPAYLEVFDGLYVFRVTHKDFRDDYLKAPRWAANVRQWQAQTGQTKLWIATIAPGWNDLDAACDPYKPDQRLPAPPFQRDRENGNFYRATFNTALQTSPDVLWINSFNEWIEGSYIEPGVVYGNQYMDLTREFTNQIRGR